MTEIRQWGDGFYILEEPRVRQFLLVSEGEALLIDTGFPNSHVADAVRSLTSAPVRVALTHGDPDHTGGLGDFDSCRAHPADWGMLPEGIRPAPLREGDVLVCGEYRLEVIEIPGHTPGSVALFDRVHRLLLPGDSVQEGGPIYLFGPHRSLPQYIASLQKLLAWESRADTILPCHHNCPVSPACIGHNLEDAVALLEGRLPGEKHPAMPCFHYRGRWTEFYGEPPAGR